MNVPGTQQDFCFRLKKILLRWLSYRFLICCNAYSYYYIQICLHLHLHSILHVRAYHWRVILLFGPIASECQCQRLDAQKTSIMSRMTFIMTNNQPLEKLSAFSRKTVGCHVLGFYRCHPPSRWWVKRLLRLYINQLYRFIAMENSNRSVRSKGTGQIFWPPVNEHSWLENGGPRLSRCMDPIEKLGGFPASYVLT